MWDRRYSEPGYAFGTEPNDFLCAMVDRIPLGRVLCIGEGEGRNAVFLAAKGYDVTAMDASAIAIQKTRALTQARGVTLTTVVADLADYRIAPAAWDGIVSIFVHLRPSLCRKVHAQVVAGLKPGGVFVLEGFTSSDLQSTYDQWSDERMITLQDLREDLASLQLEHAQKLERYVAEGVYRTGRAVVVQALARKL